MNPESIEGIGTQAGVTYALVDILKNNLGIQGRAAQILALTVGVVYACGSEFARSPGPITFGRAWDTIIRGLLTGAAAIAAHSLRGPRDGEEAPKALKAPQPALAQAPEREVIVAGDGVGEVSKSETDSANPAKDPTLDMDNPEAQQVRKWVQNEGDALHARVGGGLLP